MRMLHLVRVAAVRLSCAFPVWVELKTEVMHFPMEPCNETVTWLTTEVISQIMSVRREMTIDVIYVPTSLTSVILLAWCNTQNTQPLNRYGISNKTCRLEAGQSVVTIIVLLWDWRDLCQHCRLGAWQISISTQLNMINSNEIQWHNTQAYSALSEICTWLTLDYVLLWVHICPIYRVTSQQIKKNKQRIRKLWLSFSKLYIYCWCQCLWIVAIDADRFYREQWSTFLKTLELNFTFSSATAFVVTPISQDVCHPSLTPFIGICQRHILDYCEHIEFKLSWRIRRKVEVMGNGYSLGFVVLEFAVIL